MQIGETGKGPGRATENLTMDTEEGSPFKSLPPLPKVFREPSSPPSSSPLPGTGQEVARESERRRSGLQDSLTLLHAEMRRVRREDLTLLDRLHTLALEIQDLKEVQQEMESLSKEEPFAEERGQVGGGAGPAEHVPSAGAVAAFELTI